MDIERSSLISKDSRPKLKEVDQNRLSSQTNKRVTKIESTGTWKRDINKGGKEILLSADHNMENLGGLGLKRTR